MSGTHDALHLIELASARLFQDINGLIDLLGKVDSNRPINRPNSEGSELDASGALAWRLKLRRAAWSPDGQVVPLAELAVLAHGLPDTITLDLSTLAPGLVFPAACGRILLNLLLLAADSLPRGGIVMLAGSADDLFIRIDGPNASWPSGTALCLANETEARSALTSGLTLQMALTALLAHAAGIRLSLLHPPSAQPQPPILRLGGH